MGSHSRLGISTNPESTDTTSAAQIRVPRERRRGRLNSQFGVEQLTAALLGTRCSGAITGEQPGANQTLVELLATGIEPERRLGRLRRDFVLTD
jgi:hypothetical protein